MSDDEASSDGRSHSGSSASSLSAPAGDATSDDGAGSSWQGPKSSLTESFRKTLSESFNFVPVPDDGSGDLEPILDDEEAAPTRTNGLSFRMTVFTLVAQMAGAGFLALPAAVKNTGWIGVPMMIFFCVLVGYSGTRLGKCWVMMENNWKEYREPARQPYMEIVDRAYGLTGRRVTLVFVVLTLFGSTTVFMILTAEMMNALVPSLSQCYWTMIVCACLVPITWLGSPKDFWQLSVLAVFSTVLACAVIAVQVILEAPEYPSMQHPNPTFSSFFLGFGAILFAFGGASVFPTIQNDMADRSKFGKSVVASFSVILSLYLPVSICGYYVLGAKVEDNILMSVEGVAVSIARAMEIINLIGTYIIAFNPVAQSMEEALNIPPTFGWKRCVLRTSIVALELVVGLGIPSFGVILNFFGGSTVTACTFLFPPLCYMKICGMKNEKGEPIRVIPLWEKVLLWELIALGVVGGVSSTISSLIVLVNPAQYGNSCF